MRLTNKEIDKIKSTLEAIFEEPTIYLFGSRLQSNKKGGDIDLFIVSKDDNLLEKKIKAIAKLERVLYKPVDIVLHKDFSREIEKEALKGIVL